MQRTRKALSEKKCCCSTLHAQMLQHKKLCMIGAAAAAPIAEAGVFHSMLYQQQVLSHITGQMDGNANPCINCKFDSVSSNVWVSKNCRCLVSSAMH